MQGRSPVPEGTAVPQQVSPGLGRTPQAIVITPQVTPNQG